MFSKITPKYNINLGCFLNKNSHRILSLSLVVIVPCLLQLDTNFKIALYTPLVFVET